MPFLRVRIIPNRRRKQSVDMNQLRKKLRGEAFVNVKCDVDNFIMLTLSKLSQPERMKNIVYDSGYEFFYPDSSYEPDYSTFRSNEGCDCDMCQKAREYGK